VLPRWSFLDFVDGGGNRIEAWYQNELSREGKDGFDALLKNTHKIENHLQWGGFKFLKGEARKEHIWQLDFVADRKQYRALGVFGAERKQAVVLLGCYHKGDSYTPRDAIETACKRAKALREKRGTTCERKIKYDL
jgi:phage-related protein